MPTNHVCRHSFARENFFEHLDHMWRERPIEFFLATIPTIPHDGKNSADSQWHKVIKLKMNEQLIRYQQTRSQLVVWMRWCLVFWNRGVCQQTQMQILHCWMLPSLSMSHLITVMSSDHSLSGQSLQVKDLQLHWISDSHTNSIPVNSW